MVSPVTKIYGSMVIKNEADRYLEAVLSHMCPFFDGVFVYDDDSDDDSLEVVSQFDAVAVSRPPLIPSFLEHEGDFRFAAWRAFEREMTPEEGSWVLSFDADEFLVLQEQDFSDVRPGLEQAISIAESKSTVGVVLPFPEIFDVQDGVPMMRVDGLWPTIRGPRLFKYKEEASWNNKEMGSGSEPTYVARGKTSQSNCGLHMLHFGYAMKEDHAVKHARYSELFDHGHNNNHIQSIIQESTLRACTGPIPKWSLHA